jgi:hypothetical protein
MGKEKCFNKEDIFQSQQTRKSRVPSHKVPQTKINLCNTGLGKKRGKNQLSKKFCRRTAFESVDKYFGLYEFNINKQNLRPLLS